MSRLRWQPPFRMSKAYRSKPSPGEPSRPSRIRVLLIGFLLIALLMAVTAMTVEKRVAPVLFAWAEAKAVNLATQAINKAVEETLEQIAALELAEVITDTQGRIQAIKYDTAKISQTSAAVALKIAHDLQGLPAETLAVPLGQFLGSELFAGWAKITLKILPAGAVTATPVSSFISAGINQTIHRLYLDIVVEMDCGPLGVTDNAGVNQVVLIEDVIVGDVPSWYFTAEGLVGGFGQSSGLAACRNLWNLSSGADPFKRNYLSRAALLDIICISSFGLRIWRRSLTLFAASEGSFVLIWRRSSG